MEYFYPYLWAYLQIHTLVFLNKNASSHFIEDILLTSFTRNLWSLSISVEINLSAMKDALLRCDFSTMRAVALMWTSKISRFSTLWNRPFAQKLSAYARQSSSQPPQTARPWLATKTICYLSTCLVCLMLLYLTGIWAEDNRFSKKCKPPYVMILSHLFH